MDCRISASNEIPSGISSEMVLTYTGPNPTTSKKNRLHSRQQGLFLVSMMDTGPQMQTCRKMCNDWSACQVRPPEELDRHPCATDASCQALGHPGCIPDHAQVSIFCAARQQ